MKRVVLMRPSGPRNVGTVARVCLNFGPCELRLVSPERKSLLVHPDFEQMAHGVKEIEKLCVIVPDLRTALEGCTHAVGFTGRTHDDRTRVDWRDHQAGLAERASDPEELVALVFGNEAMGLEKADAALCHELVHIRTAAEHTSLNLAMTVGIVLSDLYTDSGFRTRERGFRPIRGEAREYLKANLKHVFGEKVARTPAARRDILASIERVFSRAEIEDRDARAWHLMLRALGSTLTPLDIGLPPAVPRARHRHLADRAKAQGRPKKKD
ncbi:MAG: RNA methyltransferase [Planctomycetes bacterium]|nr:RNA methyltransferase [Planctomycetota bacterium]